MALTLAARHCISPFSVKKARARSTTQRHSDANNAGNTARAAKASCCYCTASARHTAHATAAPPHTSGTCQQSSLHAIAWNTPSPDPTTQYILVHYSAADV